MKSLNENFTESEFKDLKAVKGERSWRCAILEEFGVERSDDE